MLADLEIAMNEGINEGKKEIIKTLFINGYSVEQIASMLKKDVQEIKSYLNL